MTQVNFYVMQLSDGTAHHYTSDIETAIEKIADAPRHIRADLSIWTSAGECIATVDAATFAIVPVQS